MPTSHSTSSSSPSRAYRGSALLRSSLLRILRVLPAVAFLWGLTAWAMGWLA